MALAPRELIRAVAQYFLGDAETVEIALATLISGGHLLLLGPVGSGKTILAKALARAIGGTFARIQMTNETLPSDILGYGVYAGGEIRIVKGPIFNNIVLIDEINRGPPRTLSALIEPMQEKQVTIEGNTFKLPTPHMIIATMNITEVAAGATAPLPMAVQDRFTASLHIGYVEPAREAEVVVLSDMLDQLDGRPTAANPPRFDTGKIYVAQEIVAYIIELVERIRRDERVASPLSTRAPIAVYRLARALALLDGRSYVVPDDVKKAAKPALVHRIYLKPQYDDVDPSIIVEDALREVEPPVYIRGDA
ncbi:ATPase associated with various cellular activities AAA_3 [Thermoproteus uzoniensis 768-20]|uniref:ATPase associated with various cellular activities AAA_3 n=1 Tax=Thermoproteus uzoniensis (strain 768-20) TaxID=999630 RepID=F2L0Y4_THEU7|nr:MoxR family ATPase [Thermoproteus uzoniensis]AEA11533.1 ATPase associated with various cellular activities AAA_3 [Thermoproteus uzoniensis 768-20]